MFDMYELIAAFVVGWSMCAIPLLLGVWRDKIETRLKYERSEKRCSKCTGRDYKNKTSIEASVE